MMFDVLIAISAGRGVTFMAVWQPLLDRGLPCCFLLGQSLEAFAGDIAIEFIQWAAVSSFRLALLPFLFPYRLVLVLDTSGHKGS